MKNVIQARDDRAKQLKTARDKAEHGAADLARREEEKARLEALVEENGLAVAGNNPSGMYELCGMSLFAYNINRMLIFAAMITHKGASADSGKRNDA